MVYEADDVNVSRLGTAFYAGYGSRLTILNPIPNLPDYSRLCRVQHGFRGCFSFVNLELYLYCRLQNGRTTIGIGDETSRPNIAQQTRRWDTVAVLPSFRPCFRLKPTALHGTRSDGRSTVILPKM
jgi:hypothetical protein